ncbi:hypothetical protein JHK87_038728 [Glycine soja]|nr:hypothetical protein JHK87_038728 [Glycine soja]
MHKTKSNPKIHGVRVSINALQCNINVYENLYNLQYFGPIYKRKKNTLCCHRFLHQRSTS